MRMALYRPLRKDDRVKVEGEASWAQLENIK